MDNVKDVRFSNSYTEHLYGFSQYDRGQKLKITGIETDANTEVHFSLSESGGESPRVLPDSTGTETIVSVPDFVFCADRMYDYEGYAFVYYSDVNVGKTERRIIMHIKARPKPADFAPPSEPDLAQKVLQELGTKLTAPSSAQIGQIFRVQSITEDGNLVLEAVDMPSGGGGGAVDDVTIDGTSIVGEDGVAVVPIALKGEIGVVNIIQNGWYGLVYNDVSKGLSLYRTNINSQFPIRTFVENAPLLLDQVDDVIKRSLCDGVAPEWTADEQAMVRKRIGISDWELIEVIDITEDVVAVERDTTLDGKPYDFKEIMIQFISAKNISSYATVNIVFDDDTYVRKVTTRYTGNSVSKMVARIDGDVIDYVISNAESTLTPSDATRFIGGQHTTEIIGSNGVSSIKRIGFTNDGASGAEILSGSKITIYARWK